MAHSETVIDKAKVTDIVYAAIDDLNSELGELQGLEKVPTAVLSGEGSSLDSLAIVSFHMILEEKIAVAYGPDVILSFEELFDSSGEAPLTVDNLVDQLLVLIDQGTTAP